MLFTEDNTTCSLKKKELCEKTKELMKHKDPLPDCLVIANEITKHKNKENEIPKELKTPPKLNVQIIERGPLKELYSRRQFWSEEEVQNLKAGVARFGAGKWKTILSFYNFNNRTTVDLKDKWRNLHERRNKK